MLNDIAPTIKYHWPDGPLGKKYAVNDRISPEDIEYIIKYAKFWDRNEKYQLFQLKTRTQVITVFNRTGLVKYALELPCGYTSNYTI